ncbi:hypothetical protein GBA52_018724 [Prunus armeniaca]|nr:hypothetical protein GBA52_018724 [Prunus armeniaca]
MATTTEPKAEAKAEPKEIEETSQPPLKYKTWVLRVSVHCEGCKKKINKSLKQIEGVYKTEVDTRQQKVTVTGNVEAETLIKKLTKSGKHAELWPDQKPNNSNEKKKGKGKNKEKQQSDCEGCEESNHGGPGGSGDNEKETVKVDVGHAQGSGNKKKNEGGGPAGNKKADDGGNMVKPNEGGGAPAKTGAGGQVKESKPEVVRQGGNLPNHPPVAEKKSGGSESDCEVEKSGGGGGGGASGSGSKNNKKKGPKGNANAEEDEGEECGAAPPSTGSPNHGNVPRGPTGLHVPQDPHGPRVPQGQGPYVPQGHYGPPGPYGSHGPRGPAYGPHGQSFAPAPANHSPPQQHVYEYQYPRYRPPMQAVHYNASFPTNSYGASHYDAPAPNSHSFTETQPPSYHLDNNASQPYPYHQPSYNLPQPSDSYGLFSDENPNGCYIM